MTPSELQRQVKAALETISARVTKDFSEYEGVYPHIVYSEISNVPALHGDDRENFFRSVYQVAIVTDNDGPWGVSLGLRRRQQNLASEACLLPL